MKTLLNRSLKFTLLAVILLFGAFATDAQERRVGVLGLEVNGKPVKSKFKVQIILGDKVGHVLKAKTDETGFILPGEAVGKDVGVIFEFDKYRAMFFLVSATHFDEEWVVGVDTEPFDPEYLKDADPARTAVIYYVRFPKSGNPNNKLVTVLGKPTVTIKRS